MKSVSFRWFGLMLCGLFLLVTTPVSASTVVRTGEAVSVAGDQRVDGNFYALSNTVAVSGVVAGDITAAAGTVTINGPVEHDVLAVAGTVGLYATVTEDVRIVAGDVTIAEAVEGSIFVLGGRLQVLSTATVQGDIFFVGGEATIEGTVKGQVLGRAERMRIDGVVEQGVDVHVYNLTLGDKARVAGDVRYVSSAELARAAGATVGGSVVRSDVTVSPETTSHKGQIFAFLISLFASLSLYLVLRRPVEVLARQTVGSFGTNALVGFAALVMAPIVIMLLLVSVLGIFLGLIGLVLVLLALLLALPLLNITAGAVLSQLLTRTVSVNPLMITLGALLVQAVAVVPVLGAVVLLLLFLATVGAIFHLAYRWFRQV